jgi:hypothetical protein
MFGVPPSTYRPPVSLVQGTYPNRHFFTPETRSACLPPRVEPGRGDSANLKGEAVESRLLVDVQWQRLGVIHDPANAPVAWESDGVGMLRAVREDERGHLMEGVHRVNDSTARRSEQRVPLPDDLRLSSLPLSASLYCGPLASLMVATYLGVHVVER